MAVLDDPQETLMETKPCSKCKQFLLINVDRITCLWCSIGFVVNKRDEIGTSLMEEEDQKTWWKKFEHYQEDADYRKIQERQRGIKETHVSRTYGCQFDLVTHKCRNCKKTAEEVLENPMKCVSTNL